GLSICLLTRRPPPRSTLFPYTTLFRSDPADGEGVAEEHPVPYVLPVRAGDRHEAALGEAVGVQPAARDVGVGAVGSRVAAEQLLDRKSTRLNSSHVKISYAVFCLKKKT